MKRVYKVANTNKFIICITEKEYRNAWKEYQHALILISSKG